MGQNRGYGDRGPRQGGGHREEQPEFIIPTADELGRIIQEQSLDSAQLLVEWAERLGKALRDGLSSSQIRGIFGQVSLINMNWGSDTSTEHAQREAVAAARALILVKPKIRYQAQRDSERGKQGVKQLARVLIPAIDLVGDNHEHFQRFFDFFEAILAYHRAAGGR